MATMPPGIIVSTYESEQETGVFSCTIHAESNRFTVREAVHGGDAGLGSFYLAVLSGGRTALVIELNVRLDLG